MKFSRVHFLLLIIFILSTLVTQDTVYGGLPLLVTPNPANGTTVSTDLVYLRVMVTYNRERVSDCLVKFYLDGEFIDEKSTNEDGLTLIDVLPEIGDHTWYVKAEKTGYSRYTSPIFSFYFHPELTLTVESLWGKTFGTGNYPIGDTIDFGVKPNIIYLGNHTRFVFQEWMSSDENGYNGYSNEWFVHLNDDIKEVARWKTQHYVEFNTIGMGTISLESDWYDSGSILNVKAEPGQGHFFSLWKGSGSGSYIGDENNIQIQVFGPMTQTSVFNIEDGTLFVDSDYGETFGSGLYHLGETVEFGVNPKTYYINENVRCLFSGWTSTSYYGYTGKEQNHSIQIESGIIQNADWTKQYFVKFEESIGGFASRDSDWYEEGYILQIIATPEKGYNFVQWVDENNNILGNQVELEIELLTPIRIGAEYALKKEFTLKIASDLNEFSKELDYYEQDIVELSVPKMVEVGNTRYSFQEWTSNTTSGYNGTENKAVYIITEPITQHAIWQTHHYVSSSDPQLAGWYEENKVIQLDTMDPGVFNREIKYEINGEKTSKSFVTVIEPLSIEPYLAFNYSILLIGVAFIILLIIGLVTYRALTE